MRKTIFWLHLAAGISAGIVILIMCVTGVLLTYEKQIIAWADRSFLADRSTPGAHRASAQTLISTISRASGATPSALTFYAGSAAASAAANGTTHYVNVHTGELMGTGSTQVRAFFRTVTDWHRYVAMSGGNRPAGKAITGASNLIFLIILITGPVLWWRSAVMWFKKGARGKALFFNWHNVFGLWALVPLVFIAVSATVISYPWASNLVYTLTGSEPPSQGGGRNGEQNRNGRAENPNQGRRDAGSREEERNSSGPSAFVLKSIDTGLARVDRELPDWKTIAVRLPSRPDAAVSFNVDRGGAGQPQHRATVTFDPNTGDVANIETFSNQNPGRRMRSWLRFIHTGEYYGLVGQTVAGIASFAGMMLAWTGFVLSLQRCGAWMKRRRNHPAATELATHSTDAGPADFPGGEIRGKVR